MAPTPPQNSLWWFAVGHRGTTLAWIPPTLAPSRAAMEVKACLRGLEQVTFHGPFASLAEGLAAFAHEQHLAEFLA